MSGGTSGGLVSGGSGLLGSGISGSLVSGGSGLLGGGWGVVLSGGPGGTGGGTGGCWGSGGAGTDGTDARSPVEVASSTGKSTDENPSNIVLAGNTRAKRGVNSRTMPQKR